MTYIRYYKSTSADSEYIDQPIQENITPIIANQVFSSTLGTISYWSTGVQGDPNYYPGEEYTGSSTLVLYAHWDIANAGSLVWKDVPCTVGGVTSNYDIDISDLYSEVECVQGKNQPFSYITFKLRKVDFLSDEYWSTRVSEGFGPKPDDLSFTQDITEFETDVFSIKGEWVYKRLDDSSDTYYTVTCFHPAEKIKNNTLTNLLQFTISGSSVTILNQTVSLTQVSGQTVKYYATTSNPNATIYFDLSDANNPYIEYITAKPIEMVKLIFIGSGLTTYSSMTDPTNPSCKIDDGFTYVDLSTVTLSNLPESYTKAQLEALKAGTKYNIPNNYTISIRPDTNCWNLLESIGKFVNCTPFFYDKLYFVDYRVPDQSISQMELDYGVPTTQTQGVTYPDILNISANEDQGSDYILSSQKVTSEAYSTTTVVSDATTSNDGEVIKYMAIEKVTLNNNDFVFDTTSRNIQCKIIALNELIKWYKPSDCVKYSISELKKIQTYSSLPASGNTGDIICVTVPDEWLDAYYKWDGSAWTQISDIVCNMDRVGGVAPYSKVGTLTDKQNGLTLSNVPLAYTYISYPTGVTTYVWGEPKFMDSEGQISDISEVSKDTTLSNTSDVQISDNYNAKIVIGNQSLSELQDDRSGFTGLILEKNWNAELYRLAGYYQGSVQAEFNTQGKISAGDGLVVLDDKGMRVISSNETSDLDAIRFNDDEDVYTISDIYSANDKLYGEFSKGFLLSPKKYNFGFGSNTKTVYADSGNVTTMGTVSLSNISVSGSISLFTPFTNLSLSGNPEFYIANNSISKGSITIPVVNGVSYKNKTIGFKFKYRYAHGTAIYDRHATIRVKLLGGENNDVIIGTSHIELCAPANSYYSISELTDRIEVKVSEPLTQIYIEFEPSININESYRGGTEVDTISRLEFTFGVGDIIINPLDESKLFENILYDYLYAVPYIFATTNRHFGNDPSFGGPSNTSAIVTKASELHLLSNSIYVKVADEIAFSEYDTISFTGKNISFEPIQSISFSGGAGKILFHDGLSIHKGANNDATIEFYTTTSTPVKLSANDANSLSVTKTGLSGDVVLGVDSESGYVNISNGNSFWHLDDFQNQLRAVYNGSSVPFWVDSTGPCGYTLGSGVDSNGLATTSWVNRNRKGYAIRAYSNNGNSYANTGSWWGLLTESVDFNTDSVYGINGGQYITVPFTGYYLVTLSIHGNSGNGFLSLGIYADGNNFTEAGENCNGGRMHRTLSTIVPVNSGQNIQGRIYNVSGNTVTLDPYGGGCSLSVVFLGV